jgi:hypothetical protein
MSEATVDPVPGRLLDIFFPPTPYGECFLLLEEGEEDGDWSGKRENGGQVSTLDLEMLMFGAEVANEMLL